MHDAQDKNTLSITHDSLAAARRDQCFTLLVAMYSIRSVNSSGGKASNPSGITDFSDAVRLLS